MIRCSYGRKALVVTLRSKKKEHSLEAASVKLEDHCYVFRDSQGNETGRFNKDDVEGYSVQSDPPSLPSF